MRTAQWTALIALAGFFAGCDGGDSDDTGTKPDDVDCTDEANFGNEECFITCSDGSTIRPDEECPEVDNCDSGSTDTACTGPQGPLAYIAYEGEATVTLTSGSEDFAGDEAIVAWEENGSLLGGNPSPYAKTAGAVKLCELTWPTTSSTYPSAITTACEDYDGNGCDWTFDITYDASNLTASEDCSMFNTTTAAGFDWSYGLLSDYQFQTYSYGTTLMYYYTDGTTYTGWYAATGGASFGQLSDGTYISFKDFITWNSTTGDLWYEDYAGYAEL